MFVNPFFSFIVDWFSRSALDKIMGAIFSKKEKSRITEQDHAILGLKKQRDQIKQ